MPSATLRGRLHYHRGHSCPPWRSVILGSFICEEVPVPEFQKGKLTPPTPQEYVVCLALYGYVLSSTGVACYSSPKGPSLLCSSTLSSRRPWADSTRPSALMKCQCMCKTESSSVAWVSGDKRPLKTQRSTGSCVGPQADSLSGSKLLLLRALLTSSATILPPPALLRPAPRMRLEAGDRQVFTACQQQRKLLGPGDWEKSCWEPSPLWY
jgi:hypothetical protein